MVNRELKIAIAGKANSGKDTLCNILDDQFWKHHITDHYESCKMAFATPIKQIAKEMFPDLFDDWLYGSSSLRDQIVPGGFKDGKPLTVRQLLIDIGTQGRQYNNNIWVDNLAQRLESLDWTINVVMISDVRYRNEFDYLRSKGFFQIRLYRTSDKPIIQHDSETKQQEIKDSEFDYVLYNNEGLKELKQKVVNEVLPLLKERICL